MHSASALRTTWICASSPRPASLPDTVRVFPDALAVISLLMKCGEPAAQRAQRWPWPPGPAPPEESVDASRPPLKVGRRGDSVVPGLPTGQKRDIATLAR